MTSYAGHRIIKAPCCGLHLTTPKLASINYSAKEYWTDGRHVGSLAPQHEGLHRCVCGGYFVLWKATEVGVLPKKKPRAPENWAAVEGGPQPDGTYQIGRENYLKYYDIRPAAAIDEEEAQIPPAAQRVADSELPGILNSGADSEVELVTRRLFWRALNDPYRETYRDHLGRNLGGVPAFVPDALQVENMTALVALLERQTSPDWLEVAELYRELGSFDNASVCAAKATPDSPNLEHEYAGIVVLMKSLVAQKVTAPVRFRF